MDSFFAELAMLTRIAVRNLSASRLKTLILGVIIVFGAVLIVVGGSLLDSVLTAMASSIQSSAAGHVQIYSDRSKDELAIWGGMGGGDQDLAAMDNFSHIRDELMTLENVQTVVPMGINGALIQSGNTIDQALAELRNHVRARIEGDASPENTEKIESLKAHVRQMARVLQEDRKNYAALLASSDADRETEEILAAATSDPFWAGFDADPYAALEFLENKLAPLAVDADLLFIRYVGTDTDAFATSFPNLEIVDGQMIPPGQRGFLMAKFVYEERCKLKTARRLDKIKMKRDDGILIASDEELQRFVKENTSQVREIVLQLDPIKTRQMTERVQKHLGSQEQDLPRLLAAFFVMDDSNFQARYDFFYAEMAPLLQLYRIALGDTLTIKAFTRTGFVQSVNVKVYGTFRFKGLEKSALAGSLNVMDLVSFRELYGYLTADKIEENRQLKEKTQVREVSRENAEAELFGGGDVVVAEATAGIIDESAELSGITRDLRAQDLTQRVYSKDEIEGGVVLNAAVILKDSSPAAIQRSIQAIEQLSASKGLGLKVVSWQQAAGIIGQFVVMLRLVLYISVLIIFIVALVVMNNAMMMATLERVREFGTLRAIGAQKGFVWAMLLVETLVIGAIFGTLGLAAGVGLVGLIGSRGIPAVNDYMFFFFSGPRLFPNLTPETLVAAFVIVTIVSALACFYPAWLATRVSPLRAMQSEE